MTTTRIVQLADGEELISYEAGERQRTASWTDDPRLAAIERRVLAKVTQGRRERRTAIGHA